MAVRLGGKGPDTRLDPVRWRRPGRSTLLRSTAVAGLLATAAMVTWSGADPPGAASCAPGPSASSDRWAASSTDRGTGSTVGGAGSNTAQEGGPGRPSVPVGSVGVPIRLAEPTALALVRPGDRVDLLRVADSGADPTAIAASALVLSITNATDPATGGLLLALKPAEAAQAVTTAGHGFAVLIRPD